ncbi:MAG: isopenicillin N synthase family oxygenase [Alphaproteobacteria bacterium]|nr:isopenicillin N synthase family oxygenase [Alphaproteobacteria bacterium]
MSQAEVILPEDLAQEEIPILDLGPFLAGEEGALERLATELRHAQEDVGFYFIVNHGVPPELIARSQKNLRRFFALPDDVKRAMPSYVPPKSTIYVSSTVNENTKPDLNEMLRIVRERPADHPAIVAGLKSHGPNHWPDEDLLPGWKEEMLEYYQAMEDLGRSMLPLYARALDMPADHFDGMFDDPVWTTRNQHYPAVEAEDNQFGIAPHRDHGFLTLLPVVDVPGLQIRTADDRWLSVDNIEGAIIVNTGEFLNRWTNGRFMATPHRVLPPQKDRYSLAFFYNPSWDAVADPLPTCVSEDNPARFKPVRFQDYRDWYLTQNYLHEGGEIRPEPPSIEESELPETI